jgi:hypothetical protein
VSIKKSSCNFSHVWSVSFTLTWRRITGKYLESKYCMPNHVAEAEAEAKQTSYPGENHNSTVSPSSSPQTAEERLLAKGGGLLTLEQVADELKEDKRIIEYQRKLDELVAVEWNGEYQYPAWQFKDGQLLPGLDRVLEALSQFRKDPWARIIFMTDENDRLGDKTPLECLKTGDRAIDEIVEAAECYGLQIAS